MKKIVLATFIMGTCMVSGAANAELLNNSLSIGYAQSHVKAGGDKLDDNPKGINIKYRYELDQHLGIASSFTYTNLSYNYYYAGHKVGNEDLDYYSLSAGPAYRFNDYISAYGLIGFGHGRVEADMSGYSNSESKTSAVYGVGLQFNPIPNLVLDASYEYSKLGRVKVGTWIAGIGYRF